MEQDNKPKCSRASAHRPNKNALRRKVEPSLQLRYLQTCVGKSPESIQSRVMALKSLQIKINQNNLEYQKAKFKLAQKFQKKNARLDEKRKELLSGKTCPSDNERPKWPQLPVAPVKLKESEEKYIDSMVKRMTPISPCALGIPGFWLCVMKAFDGIAQTITAKDEPLLLRLLDIKLVVPKAKCFKIEFHFDRDNGYFTNTVLTKKYVLKFALKESDPLSTEGPKFVRSEGCIIKWLPKSDLTVRCVYKTQIHYCTYGQRKIIQHFPQESFFNFFNMNAALGEHVPQRIKRADEDMGMLFRTQLVPKAVRYYAGDLVKSKAIKKENEEVDPYCEDSVDELTDDD